jgi:hypothetical protein
LEGAALRRLFIWPDLLTAELELALREPVTTVHAR